MNVFLREMKANRKALILWAIGILFMIAGGMGKYAGFQTSGQDVAAMFDQLPKALLAILGMANLDLGSAGGFYGLLYIYLLLMAGTHAAMLGANIIAKEERDRTAEFLYVKPASRSSIITAKLLAACANVLIINLLTLVLSVAVIAKIAPEANLTADLLLLMAGMLLFQLTFLSIGAGTAALTQKPRGAASAASGILLGAYLLYALINASGKVDWLRYFTPFKYFEAHFIMAEKALDPVYVLLSLLIAGGFITATYSAYRKKDLNV